MYTTGAVVAGAALVPVTSDDLFLSFFLSSARSSLYEVASCLSLALWASLTFWMTLFLRSLESVTSLWILAAFYLFFPSLVEKVLLMMFFLMRATPSSFLKPNNLLSLVSLLGPNLLGTWTSVTPASSASPFLTIAKARTLMSCPTMHPLIDFRFLSPVLRGLYPLWPFFMRILVRPSLTKGYYLWLRFLVSWGNLIYRFRLWSWRRSPWTRLQVGQPQPTNPCAYRRRLRTSYHHRLQRSFVHLSMGMRCWISCSLIFDLKNRFKLFSPHIKLCSFRWKN